MFEKYPLPPTNDNDAETSRSINNFEIDDLATTALRNLSQNHTETDEADNYEDDENYDNDYNDENYEEDYEDDDYGYENDDNYDAPERVEFLEDNLSLQHIPLPKSILEKYTFLEKLPSCVGVMGGVARSIAREIITGDHEPIRDIDLVNIIDDDGHSQIDTDTIDSLSRTFMPDDYAFGHGMQNDTLSNYFKTRDFTINQSLILNGELIITDYACNDLQENIIRPTYYELPTYDTPLSSRLFLKALMMRSILLEVTDSIPLLEDINIDPENIRDFDIALMLNKALSRGASVARTFTQDLAEWDLIPPEFADHPKATAKYILQFVHNFTFRPSANEVSPSDSTPTANDYSISQAMQNYHATSPIIRRALSEYDDMHNLDLGEKISGQYTQNDYDEINFSQYSSES